MIKEFGYKSIMAVPRLKKVVLNMDLGEAIGTIVKTPFICVGWIIVGAAAGALAAAMCLAEVGAMSMVRPPGVGWMALTLMEKFHRFEDQMLVTISLMLAFAPLPAVVLGGLAWRARRGE